MRNSLITFIRDYYKTKDTIPLHAPIFRGNESLYVENTIKSTFVSSVGSYVDGFEKDIMNYTNSKSAVAVVNGTSALHLALKIKGVKENDFVITQALTFVATCNAIKYCGANPIFVDVDKETMGMCPKALEDWLDEFACIDDKGVCKLKSKNKNISACIPMHTYGFPVKIIEIKKICKKWNISLIEDAAESLGSFYKNKHTGTFGDIGTLSFNGNKIITTGGGGMILTNKKTGKYAKHISTTAKIPHEYKFDHDELGYNYRMPNINAALGCAQLELIEDFVENKRKLASCYMSIFENSEYTFFKEPQSTRSNYWLNCIICPSREERDNLLDFTNKKKINTRPIWTLMNKLPMFNDSISGNLKNSLWFEDRVINLPSSVN